MNLGITSMALLVLFFVLSLLSPFSIGDSTFNYEISDRVLDYISDYTNLVGRAVEIPHQIINSKNINFNLSNPIDTCRKLFWPVKLTFPEVGDVYIGFETKLWYGYIGKYYEVNTLNVPYGLGRLTLNYLTNPDGSAGSYDSNATYDTTLRGWYKLAKSVKTKTWFGPFISLANGNSNPTIALAIPLYRNVTNSNGQIIATNQFYGVLSSNIYLTDISNYLSNAYKNTDRNVFVVDKTTGYLIATTLGVPLFTVVNGAKVNSFTFLFHINIFLSNSYLNYFYMYY